MSDGFSPHAHTAFRETGGFRGDARFVDVAPPSPDEHAGAPEDTAQITEPETDPVALAWEDGHRAGLAEGRAEAEARQTEDKRAREALALSFARLDRKLEEELRLRLRDTVAALCEGALAPLALDKEALLHRIDKAVSMLARADDDRVIRLHPEDIALVSSRLREQWHVQPDAGLERGSVRVECATGGVEDGPATWRRAIAEALHQC